MKKMFVFVCAALIFAALPAMATIRYVAASGAGAFTTINAAASAAASGDTILVGPGTYSTGTINEASKRLTYIGAGWDQTMVVMAGVNWSINSAGANRTSIEGFRIENNTASMNAFNNVDSVTFRRCLFRNTGGNGIVSWSGGRGLTVEDCIFLYAGTAGDFITGTDANYPTVFRNCIFSSQSGGGSSVNAYTNVSTSGTVEFYNCTFLNFVQPFAMSTASAPAIFINNVFYDWGASPNFGTYNASSVWDYNAAQTLTVPGTNGLSITANPFVNYNPAGVFVEGTSDLHLDPTNGVTLINSGHPSLIDFTDGSVSDRGAYGGPKPLVDNGVPNYPWAVNIVASPNLVGQGTPVNASALGRVGPQY